MNNKEMELLSYYPITPEQIKTNGKITRIKAKEGTFALKKTALSLSQMERFQQTLHFFENDETTTVTPVLRTIRGNWFVQTENAIYYLMPWGESAKKAPETVYFKTLALFHRQTNRPIPIEERKDSMLTEKRTTAEERITQLEALSAYIEKKRYFSPLELAYLLHFPLLANTAISSVRYIDDWFRNQAEEETMNEVYCHGNPSPDHVIMDGHGAYRFINVEKANVNHPHTDVAHLYHACMRHKLGQKTNGYEWLYTYKEHFPTKQNDDLLLKSYLTSLPNFAHILKPFTQQRKRTEEPMVTAQFIKDMWLLEKIQEDLEQWPEGKNKEK